MNPLPSPRAELAGCCWLPRFVAKARQWQDGKLSAEYAARFCDHDSVDDHFLRFFEWSGAGLVDAAIRLRVDAELAAWFCAQPGIDAARIAAWNELAENLGRPGFPMAARLAEVLPGAYRHLDPAGVDSIFALLEADERPAGGK